MRYDGLILLSVVGGLIAFLFIAAVVADWYLVLSGKPTISEYVNELARLDAFVAALVGSFIGFLAGLLIGHFFWPIR